jgi:glycosyltransferase involved in cell wall biosynthesis
MPGHELDDADLVVLSHLRWDWVWQRPQHLVSRIGRHRRTWFVEEPRPGDVPEPRLHVEVADQVTRAWFEVPQDETAPEWRHLDPATTAAALDELIGTDTLRDVWLYAPTAVLVAERLQPRLFVYDVMDDLASFADAPPEMELRMRRALARADLVFAGGPSLYRGAASVRGAENTHLFPSGVECSHYARSRELRQPHDRPVVGYVAVLDERLDAGLVGELAAALPDWDVHMVGPVAKIDPATLPQGANIHYLGMRSYEELPAVMAGFDVAMMPFALNEATRSISPTKTLEYLAAGLPVVSTRVPDVVTTWSSVVRFADTGTEMAQACRAVLRDSVQDRDARVAPLRAEHEWDTISSAMRALMQECLATSRMVDLSEPQVAESSIA